MKTKREQADSVLAQEIYRRADEKGDKGIFTPE